MTFYHLTLSIGAGLIFMLIFQVIQSFDYKSKIKGYIVPFLFGTGSTFFYFWFCSSKYVSSLFEYLNTTHLW